MIRTKKIAILAIIAMVLTMMPAAMFAADSDRLAGANRISTAIAIADAGWETADAVVLAPADQDNLVDALAAAPLAGQEDAPILLTYKGALSADVQDKIEALGATTVYVVGAISADVLAAVDAIDGVTAVQLSGANRWATADAINAELDSPAGTFVVGYDAIADALSVASYAAANGFAIVLSKADGTVDESKLVGDVTYLVGGTAVVKDYEGATRLSGANRFATNAAVAEGLSFEYDDVYVANGVSLVDALAVAPLAAKANAFVLLASTSDVESIDGVTAATNVIAVGGTSVVPASVVADVYDAGGEFAVESAEASNLIQVVLELSNDNYYDEDELKDEDNYEFEGEVGNKTGVEILVDEVVVDGTTVTLNLDEAVDNQTVGELVIDKKVTGTEVVFEDIEFFDKDIPTIESVKVIGEDLVKVTFSEPINFYADGDKKSDATAPAVLAALPALEDEFDFELDSKSYSVDVLGPTENDTEVNIVVYGSFKEGELTVEVDNGLEDYAGFNVTAKTFTMDVVEDVDAPEANGYKDAERDEVTLIFNEAVKLTSDAEKEDFYHTNSNDHVNDLTDVTFDDNEVTMVFDQELPEGTAYVYIKSGAIEDYWGNENSTVKVKVQVDVDETAPTIEEVEFDGDDIVITFSEELDSDSAADEDNYVVLNATDSDDEVNIRSAVYTKNSDDEGVVTLKLRDPADDLDEGDTYEISIVDVEDLAGNEVEDYSIELEYTDQNEPTLRGVYVDLSDAAKDEYVIYAEFNEALTDEGAYAADDLYKYELIINSGATQEEYNLGEAADDDDDNIDVEIELADSNKTVKITVDTAEFAIAGGSDDTIDNGDSVLTVGRVADTDDNYTAFATSKPIKDLEERSIGFAEVKATAKDTIEVKFNGNLDDYEIEDFYVSLGTLSTTTTLDIESIDVVDADEIIVYMDDKLPADTTNYWLNTISSGVETENAFGAKIATNATMEIEDEIVPAVAELDNEDTDETYSWNRVTTHENIGSEDDVQTVYAAYDGTTTSTITIVFNEALVAGYINGNLSLVELNGDDSDLVVTDVQLTSADTIEITVTGEVLRGDDITIEVVQDTNGNRAYDIDLNVEYAIQ